MKFSTVANLVLAYFSILAWNVHKIRSFWIVNVKLNFQILDNLVKFST
jgi:hypothetical protein